jgi:hypothetical protein
MQIAIYCGLAAESEAILEKMYLKVSGRHEDDSGIRDGCRKMSGSARHRLNTSYQLQMNFGKVSPAEPKLVANALFRGRRIGGLGLLRDLHDLSVLANQSLLYWTALYQATRALRDRSSEACQESIDQIEKEISWLTTQIKEAAPQALTITPFPGSTLLEIMREPAMTVPTERVGPSLLLAAAVTGAGLLGFILGRDASGSAPFQEH